MPANDRATELFDCDTEPLSPLEPMRTGMFSLLACSWTDLASDSASWIVLASWPTACTPEPPSQHLSFLAGSPPPCCCSTPWPVSARLPAAEPATELFDCSTSPSLPGLWIRTEMLLLLGFSCLDSAFDLAFWMVSATWPTACSPPPPPPCAWLTPCAVDAALPAAEPATELFDCETLPALPGLKIRTEMLLLLGFVCVEDALDSADWPVPAACSTPWTDCAWAAPDPIASRTAIAPKSAINCRFTTASSVDIERYHRAILPPGAWGSGPSARITQGAPGGGRATASTAR